MDPNVSKALTDKLYDKRKSGALELENLIRDALAAGDHDRIYKIVQQLCHDYAYVTTQAHARNGGLIGLAAAAIALGPEVARYLEDIVGPVLACFADQDARVRYYACESMYNIAKVAKGETLLYFNQVFDALCKLAADSEMSVKNGAELLDRLIKDIVSESAATYVSVLHDRFGAEANDETAVHEEPPTAFSLQRFIPLLKERITVMNPFTRVFLVSWITLLDSIPDLELVAYLPEFLGGLFRFLSDSNPDVHSATQVALEKFLAEIKKIARLKRGIAESKRSQADDVMKRSDSATRSRSPGSMVSADSDTDDNPQDEAAFSENDDEGSDRSSVDDGTSGEEDWIPGQDVQIDYTKILEILVTFLGGSSGENIKHSALHKLTKAEEEIQLTALRWIDSFFDIAPEEMLAFIPRLLSHVLPALSNDVEQVRQAANKVNGSLMNYILSLPDEEPKVERPEPPPTQPAAPTGGVTMERRESAMSSKMSRSAGRPSDVDSRAAEKPVQTDMPPPPPAEEQSALPRQSWNLDYGATVNALTLQFLNDHEATRVAALTWLIELHRKAPPGRKLEINEATFPALLKTLSDSSDLVVRRDLTLLSQMCKNTDDVKFTAFMIDLLKLFGTDRRLLETRGNLIIRHLSLGLSAERIYRTLADCLEKDEDIEFASIMVQNLNNNLITAPELADVRKRLRNLETRDGQTFFVTLFRSWCHNAVSTFSLCLLAQAYEQAYNLLQIFADLEMTVNMLIQVDKLVQLLESPVFTYLRLQLLEPDRYPHLYKCLYGLLMLLPQSSAFAALKNRLNSVSAIGYLHIPLRASNPTTPSASTANFERPDRPNRLKAREEGGIRWTELLEKFRAVQERARRVARGSTLPEFAFDGTPEDIQAAPPPPVTDKERRAIGLAPGVVEARAMATGIPVVGGVGRPNTPAQRASVATQGSVVGAKGKPGLGLGRFAGGVGGRKTKR
ncbi:ARM repeat-containing protein [Trichodelitschia bisporula]|uniref:ARM repeat-containing protein n=1 Tax=Trichodelitschia bisporula TaxID=703511 RepID=A0A6G1I2U5_9PEZI|nr:ARM repeat-containing protein [Trichodelitschia bisporula]